MLRKTVYPKFESVINKTADWLGAKGISPNQLTLSGLGLIFVVGFIYARGWIVLGGILLLVVSLSDLLDGPLARRTGRVTRFGAFLDSTIDRYADFFIFGGLSIHFARENEVLLFLMALGILAGSFVTSYAKARAENMIKDCSVGWFGRAERIILLALGSFLPPVLPLFLLVLFAGTNATAILRILHTKRELEKIEPLSEKAASSD